MEHFFFILSSYLGTTWMLVVFLVVVVNLISKDRADRIESYDPWTLFHQTFLIAATLALPAALIRYACDYGRHI